MITTEIKSFIFQSLLERNYELYVSVINDSFVISRDGVCGSAVIIQTTNASHNRTILDLRCTKGRKTLPFTKYTYIIGFDDMTNNIWLIPMDDIADNRTLNMGEAKDNYLLLDQKDNEPNIAEKALREAVHKTISKMNTEQMVEKDEEAQKKEIDNILNERI